MGTEMCFGMRAGERVRMAPSIHMATSRVATEGTDVS